MKKHLFLLPFLLFSVSLISQHCSYTGTVDYSDICKRYSSNKSFLNDQKATDALDEILNVQGLAKRFILVRCDDIDNAIATVDENNLRFILYDSDFMEAVSKDDWGKKSILAHEVGHHVNNHILGSDPTAYDSYEKYLEANRNEELEADYYSGFVMYRLNCPSLAHAQSAIANISSNSDDSDSTHPSRDKRLKAIEAGWNAAKNSDNNNSEIYVDEDEIGDDDEVSNEQLSSEDYFYIAYDYSQKEEYLLAIENYKKSIELKADANAYYNMALDYLELEKFEEALLALDKVIKLSSDNNTEFPEAYLIKGQTYLDLKKHQLAVDNYTMCINVYLRQMSSSKSNFDVDYLIDAYLDRGHVLNIQDKFDLSLEDFKSVVKLDSENGLAYYNMGQVKINLGEDSCVEWQKACNFGYEKACSSYNEECSGSSSKNNKNALYYFNKGYDYLGDEKWELAIENFTKSIELDDPYHISFYNRAIGYLELKNYQESIDDNTRAIELKPDYVNAYINRSIAKHALNISPCSDYKRACELNYGEACDWFEDECSDINQYDDDQAAFYFDKGFDYLEDEKWELAIKNFTKAIELENPNNEEYYLNFYNRGVAYVNLEKWQETIDDNTRAIELNPDYANAYINRSIAKDQLNINPCSDYQKACQLGKERACDWFEDDCSSDSNEYDDDRANIYFDKGFDYLEDGKWQLAIKNFTKAIELENPNNKEYYLNFYNRGLAYSKLGKHQESIDDNTRAIELNPDYASAYINRSIAKYELNINPCSDYKKACQLGKEKACSWFEDECDDFKDSKLRRQ